MDVMKVVQEQISEGHKAGELLGNPAFKRIVDDLAVEYYNDFRKANVQNATELLMAHLHAVILEEIVHRLQRMMDVSRSNVENMG